MKRAWIGWAVVPVSAGIYQIAAKSLALAVDQQALGLAQIAARPEPWCILFSEAIGFFGWMQVLARWPVSAAFPLSAASYVLVLAASWGLFHEPVHLLQLVGVAAILAGVGLVASRRPA